MLVAESIREVNLAKMNSNIYMNIMGSSMHILPQSLPQDSFFALLLCIHSCHSILKGINI
jgi:hypothetical protein